MSSIIKKRTRPNVGRRELEDYATPEPEAVSKNEDDQSNLTPEELLALRKLQRGRQGIDLTKLNKGDTKKRKRKEAEPQEIKGGLSLQSRSLVNEESDEETKARRVVRSNNFTQQTNVLDVDKHMMLYIEENMKKRRGDTTQAEEDEGPRDPFEELYRPNKNMTENFLQKRKNDEDGSVTNSMAMLTAIPEVDLGIDTRLKNIEETEKAKRQVTEERRSGKSRTEPLIPKDEEHLAAARFFRSHSTAQLDAEALRRAKLEAMGLSPEEEPPKRPYENRNQTATDEQVMERFKKRMRK